jgi:hypothetical protein
MFDSPTTLFITLRFDAKTERAIATSLRRLAAEGIAVSYGSELPESRHRPHLTVAAFDTLDLGPYQSVLKSVAEQLRPISIRFHSLGIFVEKNVLYLAPRITLELLRLHQTFHTAFSGAQWPMLKYEWLGVGMWTPHCTLVPAGSVNDLLKGVELCADVWEPLEGRIEGVGILVPPATEDCVEYRFAGGSIQDGQVTAIQ